MIDVNAAVPDHLVNRTVQLFGMGSPNVVKMILMLEEIDLPYEMRPVNVFAGEQDMPDFRRLNPNGKVPVLVDPDGPGGRSIVLFESGAILIYLGEKRGALMPTDLRARHTVMQWLMLQMSGIGPMGGQAIHFGVLAKEDGYARNRFDIEIERLLDVIDIRLSQAPYLGGETYSIADVAMIPWIRTLRRFRPRVEERTGLMRWFDTLRQRPAVERTFALADRLSAADRDNMGRAPKEMLDRYSGRVPHRSS